MPATRLFPFGSRFFWKLYAAFALLALLTLVATGALVHQQLRAGLQADLEARLRDVVTVLLPYAGTAFEAAAAEGASATGAPAEDATRRSGPATQVLQEDLARMGERTGTRITLIAPSGVVIADSDRDPATMDNHGARPEIVAARAEPYGVARRFSATMQEPSLYVAVAVRDGERVVGTVRASIPLAAIEARLGALRNTIVAGAALGLVLALVAGLLVARRITAPLARMTDVADALRAGHYEQRLDKTGADEIGVLGDTLNRLADELTHRIATLAEQRAQLGAMISSLQEAVIAVDENGHLVFHNEAAASLFPGKLAATGDLLVHLEAPELAELCRRAATESTTLRREINLAGRDREIIVEVRAAPFATADQHGVVAVLQDVTRLRRLERVRTEFVANVSHELKTPLTSIRGYVDTLLTGAVHDDAHNVRFLNKIEQQVERLNAMVSDLLSLARIEAGATPPPAQAVDWCSIVDGVVARYREAGSLDGHDCRVESSAAPIRVRGDADSMTQVIENLLDNAIKYTPQGGGIVVRVARAGSDAVVRVQDDGIGVSAADRERIFERFFRADRARSRDTGGTGLGLAIVKHLVQGMGGEITVESELGAGSTFTVRAPLIET